MVSYEVYKFLHSCGFFGLFAAVVSLSFYGLTHNPVTHPWKKAVSIIHGIAMILILVSGFGLLARLGIMHGGLPIWAWIKLFIWALFMVSLLVVKKKPEYSKFIWVFSILLFIVAAWVARFKPFYL